LALLTEKVYLDRVSTLLARWGPLPSFARTQPRATQALSVPDYGPLASAHVKRLIRFLYWAGAEHVSRTATRRSRDRLVQLSARLVAPTQFQNCQVLLKLGHA
jgi:hypothetical protein